MNRKRFLRAVTFGFAALAACFGLFGFAIDADEQPPGSPRRVGVLVVSFSPESKEAQAFRQGLRDAGYEEGRDVIVEWRYANGDYAQVPELVADLVQRKVDVIVADGTVAAKAAQGATSTIPIVMAFAADPVGSRLVASLARPGGNVTGLSMMITEFSAKRLQLIKETIPRVARVAVLWNRSMPWHAKVIESLKAAAPSLSIELSFISVQTPEEIGSAFSAVRQAHAQALYVIENPIIYTQRAVFLKLASKARLPAIYPERRFVDDGGLMSYGTNFGDLFRRSAGYVDSILKGAKPADLPIEQPIKFDFVVNLKTAKTLGITIPQAILIRADEVIR
jgi:putative ABC transport system substrate-binding protein